MPVTPPRGYGAADGRLTLDGHDLVALARAHGTPLFVFSEARLRGNARRFRQAAEAGHPRVLVCYASKACSNLSVLAAVREEGLGAEVNSGGELYKALAAGVAPKGEHAPKAQLREKLEPVALLAAMGIPKLTEPRARQLAEHRIVGAGIVRAEIGRGAHPRHQHRDLPPLKLGQHRVEIGLGQAWIEAAQHVVGAKLEDDEIGLSLKAVEGPAEPRLARFAGVARYAAVDHFGGDAVAPERRLQLGSEAQALVETIACGQAVTECEHQLAGRMFSQFRRSGADQDHRQKGGGNRPADHGA